MRRARSGARGRSVGFLEPAWGSIRISQLVRARRICTALAASCGWLISLSCVRADRPRSTDAAVLVGETMRPAAAQRTAPIPVAKSEARAPVAAVPTARHVVLGKSVRGLPLELQVFGDGPDTVFIMGGIHGSEPTSAALARRLAEYLGGHADLWAGHSVGILAEANPDGLSEHHRTNAHGVDLNRNFPARNWQTGASGANGLRPASEPETAAILGAIEQLKPSRVLAIHSSRRGGECNNYDGPAEDLARRLAARNGYPVRANIGYPTPGSLGTWAGLDRHIPIITLELPADLDAAQCWRENARALVAFIRTPEATAGQ